MTSMAMTTVHDKTIEVVGADGCVTTLIQRADGGVEIYTDAMAKSGRAIRVPSPSQSSDSSGNARVRTVEINR